MMAGEAKAIELDLRDPYVSLTRMASPKACSRGRCRLRPRYIATGVARASASTGRTNGEVAERAGHLVFQFRTILNGFLFAQGGEPIMEDGVCVGAVGISGGTTGQLDENIAKESLSA
jgi:uncharacterized protein GlcG (DUF336 family)